MADKPSSNAFVRDAIPSTVATPGSTTAPNSDVQALSDYQAANADRRPVEPGLMQQIRDGIRYALTGKRPQSWFGPGVPLPPVAQEGAEGRKFDYPAFWNLNTKPRATEPIGFDELRAIADGYDLLRLVIETRKDQLEKLEWSIQLKADASGERPTPDDRCDEITRFFERPDKERRWKPWLRALIEDVVVIDAPALYVRRNRAGKLYALELVNGATIKPLLDITGRTPAPDQPAYQQVLKGLPAVDYVRPAWRYEDVPVGENGLKLPELLYRPRNLRTHKVYGYSQVEQVLMTVNIGLRHQTSQLEYFTRGNVPDAFLGAPATWDAQKIKVFQEYWDAIMEGAQSQKRRVKFVPGDVKYIPTREAQLKGEFDEWLARVVCFAFSIAPTAFVQQVNRATAETQKQQALEEGLAPLMGWVKELIDDCIEIFWGAKDIEFVWADVKDIDPKTQADINVAYIQAGVLTADEVRSDLGLPPLDGPAGDEPNPDEMPGGPGQPGLPPGGGGQPGLPPPGGAVAKSWVAPSSPTSGIASYSLERPAKRLFPGAGWLRRRLAGNKDALAEQAPPVPTTGANLREFLNRLRQGDGGDPFGKAAGPQGTPVAKAGPQDKRDPLDRIAESHEPALFDRLRAAFAAAVPKKPANDAAPVPLPTRGDVQDLLDRALDPVAQAFADGGRQAANDNPVIDAGGPKTISFRFDMLNPATLDAARNLRLVLAGELTDQAMASIQEALSHGISNGLPPAETARNIRDVVGLAPNQAQALLRYRAELESLDPGALARGLRDKRFDGTIAAAIKAGEPLSAEQVDRMVGRYSEKLQAYRASMIARTESIRAANAGALEAVKQAAARGDFGNRKPVKRWLVSPDEKVCPVCTSIPKLNPDGVGLDEDFQSIKGPVQAPPDPHPHCRCTLTFDTEPSETAS